MPKANEIIVREGMEWCWVQPTKALRGFWGTTDCTGIEVLPPSDDWTVWMVTLPRGNRERLVQCADETAAFRSAAKVRRFRTN